MVVLDTSQFTSLCHDRSSNQSTRVANAIAFLDWISDCGCVLCLTIHHIEELLAHENDEIVLKRLNILRSLPIVAWLTTKNKNGIGSIVDLHAMELMAAVQSPNIKPEDVQEIVRKSAFQYGTGWESIEPYSPHIRELREHALKASRRHRELVAISESEISDISRDRLVNWLGGKFNEPSEISNSLQEMKVRLTENIGTKGDERIPDAEDVATTFIDSVASDGNDLLNRQLTPIEILRSRGIVNEDITSDTTVGDITALAEFRERSRIACESWNLSYDTHKRINPRQLPSWIIRDSLKKSRKSRIRNRGSDLNDAYFAALIPYVDLVYFDKRTFDDLVRAGKNNSFINFIINRAFRAVPYSMINKHVNNQSYQELQA